MVRGAGQSGNLAVVSGVTGWSVEEVAEAASSPLLFQLYFAGPRSWAQELLGRVEATGAYKGRVFDGRLAKSMAGVSGTLFSVTTRAWRVC